MRLKIVTAILMLFGVVMMFATPWVVGKKPDGPRAAIADYALRFGLHVILLILVFSTTAVLAYIVARRQQEAFRAESLKNLKDLVEGTLKDHGRNPS